jgi:uncharacterized protein YciI
VIFAILGEDAPEAKPLRQKHRAAHLERVEALNAEGRMILAGPFSDGSGSLIVIEAASQQEAEAWIAADPYVTGGVFIRHTVRPFHPVYPKSPIPKTT